MQIHDSHDLKLQLIVTGMHLSPEFGLTIDDIIISNNKIVSAYFNAGLIYKEKLFDPSQSIKTFKRLNDRFPNNTNRPAVLYFLFRLNTEIDSFAEAREYKDMLIDEFPNSDYSKIIQNPCLLYTSDAADE